MEAYCSLPAPMQDKKVVDSMWVWIRHLILFILDLRVYLMHLALIEEVPGSGSVRCFQQLVGSWKRTCILFEGSNLMTEEDRGRMHMLSKDMVAPTPCHV